MHANTTSLRFLALVALVAAVSAAAGFGLWRWQAQSAAPDLVALKLLPEPRVLADFRLVDQQAQAFSLDRLEGRWSLLFFGFTHCPDVCPSALYELQQVREGLLRQHPAREAPQVVLVSVDPERDSPGRLRDYLQFFDPAFVGVTGDDEQLRPLALQIGVAYRIEPHEPGAPAYEVDHSAGIFVINPDARLHGVFPAPQRAAEMIRDIALLTGGKN